MRLSVNSFALAGGILCAVVVFIFSLFVVLSGGGQHLMILRKLFFGYSVSIVGSCIGLVWGFIYGFILSGLFAWIHNWFVKG